MKTFRQFSAIAALLAVCSAQADFNAGLQAIGLHDYPAAFEAFKPLAEQGNAAAQVNLGNLYMKGLGTEQNYTLALRWYLSAAAQGERMAQSKVGILYYHGLGVAKDPAEAARWFQKAAEQGVTSAQSILGSLYAAGDGVPQDLARAYYWFTMAEEQGDVEGGKGRKSLEEEMNPAQKDEALRLMAETRKLRTEQDEKAFTAATAGLGTPPAPVATPVDAKGPAKPAEPVAKAKPNPKKALPDFVLPK
jgi:TPR repeat protein